MKAETSQQVPSVGQNSKPVISETKSDLLNKCIGNRKAVFLCTNDKCEIKHRFTCGVQQCKCENQHTLCLRANAISILRVIEKKNQSINIFKAFIDQTITKIIDQLSDFRQRLLCLVDDEMKFVAQFQAEREFLDIVNNTPDQTSDFNAVNSALLWKIINSKDFGVNNLFNQTKKLLQGLQVSSTQLISKFNTKLNQLILEQIDNQQTKEVKLQSTLRKNKQSLTQVQKNLIKSLNGKSLVVKTSQNWENVIKYFTKPLKNITLAYRASSHNFKIKKFYQLCGNVQDLMIICQSFKGKIVGGYSPLCHYEQNLKEDTWVTDSQLESFIFELTSNRKFFLEDKDQAISISVSQQEICFGDDQIVIVDEANIHRNCKLDCNVSYKNPQYYSTDSRIRLNGFKNFTCTLDQWQAWKIQFQS